MNLADIKLWHILRAPNCRHAKSGGNKFVVCAAIEGDDVYAFMINSHIRPYLLKRPALLVCEADIFPAEHPAFLVRDSHIDCTDLYDYKAAEFDQDLGLLHDDALVRMIEAVERCTVLPRDMKQLIRKSGRDYLAKNK